MRVIDVILTFGNCEVRVATRELLVHGQLQAVPPKAFDVLVVLLVERQRAVSKQELIDKVWNGAALSGSVLARTVMLLRRLIGDDAECPVWIQNVYGFGYRFGGQVVERQHAPATVLQSPAKTHADVEPMRVGLLPLRNETTDPSLAWTPFGLMALVAHALERDRRLVVTAIGADFAQQLPAGLTAAAVAREARELYGLRKVVQAVLRSHEDMLWIDYQVFDASETAVIGSVRDGDVIALGERLSRAVAGHLLPGAHESGAMPSHNALVNQLFARAREYGSTQDWRRASAMLDAAATLEPENLTIELERLRCEVWLTGPASLAKGESLLERLLVSPTPRLISDCHDLIAQALAMSGDDRQMSSCEDHREKALAWANSLGRSHWSVSLRINTGNFYLDRGQFERGREHLALALAESRQIEDLVGTALSQQNLSIIDRNEGNLIQAKQRLEESLHIWRRLLRRPVRGHALTQLALANLHLGLFDEAIGQCEDALRCFNPQDLPWYDGASMAGVGLIYLQLGHKAAVDRLAEQFRKLHAERPQSVVPWHVVSGCAAIMAGDGPRAREHLLAAVGHGQLWPGISFRLRCLHALLTMELAQGQAEDLAACQRALERLLVGQTLPEGKAGIEYAQAAQQLLAGDRAGAQARLHRVATDWPLGMCSQMARLDVAWMLLENGSADPAQALMDSAPTWRDRHPAGLALKARWHAVLGQHREAWRWQREALALCRIKPHPVQQALVDRYQRLAEGRASAADGRLPSLPRFLCATWSAQADAAPGDPAQRRAAAPARRVPG